MTKEMARIKSAELLLKIYIQFLKNLYPILNTLNHWSLVLASPERGKSLICWAMGAFNFVYLGIGWSWIYFQSPFAAADKPQSCAQGNPPRWQSYGFVSPERWSEKWSEKTPLYPFLQTHRSSPSWIPQLRDPTQAVVVWLHSLCWFWGGNSLLSSRADTPICTSWAATISSELPWKLSGTLQGSAGWCCFLKEHFWKNKQTNKASCSLNIWCSRVCPSNKWWVINGFTLDLHKHSLKHNIPVYSLHTKELKWTHG